jgi:hypothetical protein
MPKSGYGEGGFEDRYRVTRTDGQPIREEAHYVVLNYADDPHARVALEAYAASVRDDNPQLSEDFMAACRNPADWPKQHD